MSKRRDERELDRMLYRPLDGRRELAELEAEAERVRRGTVAVAGVLGAVAAGLLGLNLLTTAGNTGADIAGRWWSLFPILSLAFAAAPLLAKQLWVVPRALEAQRRLLAERGLLIEGPEVAVVEERLAARIAGQARPQPELGQRLAQARLESAELVRSFGAGAARGADSPEQIRVRARLAAYRVALGNLEIDALLEPGFLDSPSALAALAQAARHLRRQPDTSRPER